MATTSPTRAFADANLSKPVVEDNILDGLFEKDEWGWLIAPARKRDRMRGKRVRKKRAEWTIWLDEHERQPEVLPEPPFDEFQQWMNGYRNVPIAGEDVEGGEKVDEPSHNDASDRPATKALPKQPELQLKLETTKYVEERPASLSDLWTKYSEPQPTDIGPSVSRRNSPPSAPRNSPRTSQNDGDVILSESIISADITAPSTGQEVKTYIVDKVGSRFAHSLAEKSKKTPQHSREPSLERPKADPRKDLSTSLFDSAKSDLFYAVATNHDPTKPKTAILNICTLQHLELRSLQYRLAAHTSGLYDGSCNPLDFTAADRLRDYCDGIRNLNIMRECALRGYEDDPFLLKTSRAIDRQILEAVGLVPDHVLPSGPLPPAEDSENPQLRPHGRNEANKTARGHSRSERLLFASVGGLSLIVPMLIMANVPGKVASLMTTCVALLIFVVVIAFLTKLSPNEVLATTAAYAAVLVVFVGTSLSGGGNFTQ